MVLKSPLERTQAFSTPRKPTAGIPASNVEDALKYIKENASGGLASVEDDPAPRLGGDLALNGHQITGLATVATSGSYDDLTSKPTLGSAASHAASDFATAAQGAKADSAVQPGALGTSAALNVDTDGAMAANSDTRVPSQKAVRTYLDARISALDVVEIKGGVDCSTNPNYPAADAGYLYKVTVAGKIGGASGPNVEAGDTLLCFVDGSSSGNQAAVGANWTIVQVNIDGAVIGPASSTSGNIATFNGTGGKLLQDSGKALPSGTIVGTSDTQTLTNKTFDTAGTGNSFKINGTAITDKTGTGKAVLDTSPTLTNPVVGTQTALDNSTKAASTAYVDRTTRQVLTANQTYYVRTDGSDSNNGLANTSGGAFLTIQKAIDVVAALDLSIYDATIKCGAGTRTAPIQFKRTLGAGTASLEGDVTTPSNCTLSTTNVPCVQMTTGAAWKMRGFKFVVATSTYSISCEAANCDLTIDGNVEFGATPSYHVVVGAKGAIRFLAPYTISSGATNHIFALTAGFCYYTPGTVTLTGSPAFTSFVAVTSLALLTTGSTTFSGTVTGKRYDVALNGVINTFGGGASYFPGNAAGTTATGGQYA